MPRPTPSQAQPVFSVRPVSLSDKARAELLQLAGYGDIDLFEESLAHQMPDAAIVSREPGAPVVVMRGVVPENSREKTRAGQMILEVEAALGLAVDGAEHLDKMPRPSDYRTVYSNLNADALALLSQTKNLSKYYRDQFLACDVDIEAIDHALALLADTSRTLERKFAGMSSKGAPKKIAQTETISRLRRIFRDHYRGPMELSAKRGSAKLKSVQGTAEFDFVWRALIDARVMADFPKNLRLLEELLRDPRTAQREDRAETIERIAKRSQRKRGTE